MKTVEFIKSVIPAVLDYYGLPPVTGIRHYKGECPICNKRGKFRIDNKNNTGSYICTCSSGDIWKLLQEVTGKDFKTLAHEIDQTFGNEFKPDKNYQAPISKEEQHVKRFTNIKNIKGTAVETYLNGRGIHALPEMSVKLSQAEWDHEYNRSFVTMYSIATDDQMNIAYAHKTYLENGVKAGVDKAKKITTITKLHSNCEHCNTTHSPSVAIKLFAAGDTLGIAEGIETALSASQQYKLPVWAVMNASFMESFKAPAGVKHLIIYADNDVNGRGLAAAFKCANKNYQSNNDVTRVTVKWPETYGVDFNDMIDSPCNTYEWVVGK